MIAIEPQYDYLLDEPSPRILVQALKEYGTLETPGTEDNPKIIGWAQEIGRPVSLNYQHDSTPWCGLFMAVCAKRAGLELPPAPLWALSWSRWGNQVVGPAMLGDIMVFKRAGGGGVRVEIAQAVAATALPFTAYIDECRLIHPVTGE